MQNRPPSGAVTFEDLYAKHAVKVLAVVSGLGVSEAARLDVAQDVWTQVFRGLETYNPRQGTERAWILGIARNLVRDFRRAERRKPEFSAFDEAETSDGRTAETVLALTEQRQAVNSFLLAAIPNADQHEAFILHEVGGLTVEEVAEKTGVRLWTAQWRLKMARQHVKKAEAAMSDEDRKKMRTLVVPIVGVNVLVEKLQSSVSDEDVAAVWERVSKQIELEGGSTKAVLGGGNTSAPPSFPSRGHLLTTKQLVLTHIGSFVGGAIVASAVFVLQSHAINPITTTNASNGAIVSEAPMELSVPKLIPEPLPEPSPTSMEAPTANKSRAKAPLNEPSETILIRARTALLTSPGQALALSMDHAGKYPGSNAAEREEIIIRALFSLGRRAEAQERAEKLVRRVPSKRPAMETLFGRSFF